MAKSADNLCFGLAVGEREWSEGGAEQSRSGMTRANSQTEAPHFCAPLQAVTSARGERRQGQSDVSDGPVADRSERWSRQLCSHS